MTRPIRAACLTPPAAGGVAVVQIAGPAAAALVQPLIRASRPVELHRLGPDSLRLCRWMDGGEVIDDALVAVRRSPAGEDVIDVSLHGGPRIVQRVLITLQRAGAEIVLASEMIADSVRVRGALEYEALSLLPRAETRQVASWLVQAASQVAIEISHCIANTEAGNIEDARATLASLCRAHGPAYVRYLLDGVRVVLTGPANVGKSTLANALAGREHAIVSDTPGTTRDWVDHAGAIDGVPYAFVDTAGLRETADPVELEAVRKARQQLDSADIVLRVIDASHPPTDADEEGVATLTDRRNPVRDATLLVWNKTDLPHHPGQDHLMRETGASALAISARTGEQLAELRDRLARAVGMTGWQRQPPVAFTDRQREACSEALSELARTPPLGVEAVERLRRCLSEALPPGEPPPAGV